MTTETNSFDELARVLFDGEHVASDIKTLPGVNENVSLDHAAWALLASMKRTGLVKDGVLVNKNR